MTTPIETSTQVIHLAADGIIRAKIKAHAELTQADAEEAVRVIASLGSGTPLPVLVDMSEIKFMSREARVYFAGPQTAKVESAVGLVIRSPLTRAIGNFFMGLNKPLFPTRLFTSESEALVWLREFVT